MTTTTWKVAKPVHGEHGHALFGRIVFAFDAGAVTPKNEAEEWVLEAILEPAGLAERAPKRKRED